MSSHRLARGLAVAVLALAGALAARPALAQTAATTVPTTPGRHARATVHAGIVRAYIISIPTGYDAARPAPLLLVFHGHGQTARSFARRHPDLFREADAAGFILVLPQATTIGDPEGKPRWLTEVPDAFGVDDPGFVLGLVGTLSRSLAIDARRVHAAGFSNGGGMTHHLGATRPDVFAAIAIVASGLGHPSTAQPTAPVPALLVYGRRDTTRPYDGEINEHGFLVPPAREIAEMWARADGCLPVPARRASPGVTIDRYGGCREGTEVIFVTVDRMDHSWPDAADGWGFDMNETVIAFCWRHRN